MFSNAASNWLHSPTGYICLTFIHCVFSNVSSSGLSEWMQNHTGFTCLLFLRCVFSNIPSDCLPWRMCNHTFYICMVFSNVSNVYSNAPHERIHSHIGCICFSSVCVFSCPEQLNRWPCHSLTQSVSQSLTSMTTFDDNLWWQLLMTIFDDNL